MIKRILTTCLAAMLAIGCLLCQRVSAQARPPQTRKKVYKTLGKNSVREVIAAMTLEEKVKLLVGMGVDTHIVGLPGMSAEDKKIPEKVPGAAGRTHAIARLGIPSLTLSDGPAGVRIPAKRVAAPSRTFYATGFPVATLLASTWDPAVVTRVGAALGSEVRDYGIDVLLAPAINIHRNPLGGRNFEYYSEDPLITGRTAAAYISGVQSAGVGTSIKHFAANNQEFNRLQSNSVMGQRALREIYLKGFEIAIKEAQPWTVMTSYNLINGTYTSQSHDLVTRILRDEWGFKGFVMTDWVAGSNPAEQMGAGNDLLMPGYPEQTQAILDGVRKGRLSEKQLDENLERMMNIIQLSPAFKRNVHSDRPDLKTNAEIAREAATEGMVLLKNGALKNGSRALPLAVGSKIALYGNASYETIAGGTGSGDVNKAYVVNLDQGLSGAGYLLDANQKEIYARYMAEAKRNRPKPKLAWLPPAPIGEMPAEPGRVNIRQDAAEKDVALITIGRSSGEGDDRTREDFNLSANEQSLIANVSDAFHARGKKVIVVMNVAGVTEVASWRDRVDAVLLAWLPGQEGGNSIADVISGKVDPSGHLATTFPVRYDDVPSARTFPGHELTGAKLLIPTDPRCEICRVLIGKPSEADYDEGIYVGYRYYQTFKVKPAYEFGYGLSYTDFAFNDMSKSTANLDGVATTVTVKVTNEGKTSGREVVQLYVSAPAGKLDKPESELKAFRKTRLLKPGESETLSFTLTARDLASFDPARSAWIAEPGVYTVKIGASSMDIRQSGHVELKREAVVEQVANVLAPQGKIDELRPKK